MKKLFLLLICLILIPVLIIGGALAIVYFSFFNPQPANYPYLHETSEITSIQFAEVSFEGGNINTKAFGIVDDVDALMDDLNGLQCHKGLSLGAISRVVNNAHVAGLIINYKDGSYEILTAYVCVNSKLSINTIEDVLNMPVYGYDVDAFHGLIENHKGFDFINDELKFN